MQKSIPDCNEASVMPASLIAGHVELCENDIPNNNTQYWVQSMQKYDILGLFFILIDKSAS